VTRYGSFERHHNTPENSEDDGSRAHAAKRAPYPPTARQQQGPAAMALAAAAAPPPRGDRNTIQGEHAHKDQFERLKAFVDDLECPTNNKATVTSKDLPKPQMILEAMLYFTSYKATAYTSNQKNLTKIPWQYTYMLVNYMQTQYHNSQIDANTRREWIQKCIGNYASSPCLGLVQAMDIFLRPTKGSSVSIRNFGIRKFRRKDNQAHELLQALTAASKVHDFMDELVRDDSCPVLTRDFEAFLKTQELWKSRCWYLGAHTHGTQQLTPEQIHSAFGGAKTASECLNIMRNSLHEIDAQLSPTQREKASAMFVSALAVSNLHGSANEARQILNDVEQKQTPKTQILYNAVMLAFANEAKYNKDATHGAKELWNQLLDNRKYIQSNSVLSSTLLNAYSNANMPEAVEKILIEFEELPTSLGVRPTRIDYNIAIDSWAKSTHPKGTERALALFERMLELSESGNNPDASPDKITYTGLIDAFARNPNTGPEGLDQAEYLLQHAESGKNPEVKPDATMYHNYMSALLKRLTKQNKNYGRSDIAIRIEQLMHRMRNKSRRLTGSEASRWHSPRTYGTAIFAWSKTKSPESTERGLQIFRELKQECKRDSTFRPDQFIYHAVLACLGERNSTTKNNHQAAVRAISKAREIISEMEQGGIPLTIDTMNLYLKVLIAGGMAEGVEEAENFLESLEKAVVASKSQIIPDTFSYQIIMEGYAKLDGGAEHVERTLHKFIELAASRPSLHLNNALFAITMNAWSRSGRDDAVEQAARIMREGEKHGFQPDAYSYTTLINTLAFSGRRDAPEIAESLLGQMQADFESGKNPNSRPTEGPISAVLKCWELSERPEAPDRIDAIVRRATDLFSQDKSLIALELNYSSLKHGITAWMKRTDNRPDAGDRATMYLDIVEKCVNDGKLEGHFAIHCYNAVLVTIARSRDGDKAGKAYHVLKRLEKAHYVRSRDYRAVLSACLETASLNETTADQKKEAFHIANVTFLEYLESKLKPNEDVYNDIFRVHATLLEGDDLQQERETLICSIFTKSPNVIQQSIKVRAALRAALSMDTYKDLVLRTANESIRID